MNTKYIFGILNPQGKEQKFSYSESDTIFAEGEPFYYIHSKVGWSEHKLREGLRHVAAVKKEAEKLGMKVNVYGSAGRIPLFRKVDKILREHPELPDTNLMVIGSLGKDMGVSLAEYLNYLKDDNLKPIYDKVQQIRDADTAATKHRMEVEESIMDSVFTMLQAANIHVKWGSGGLGREIVFPDSSVYRANEAKIKAKVKELDTEQLVNGSCTGYVSGQPEYTWRL